MADISILGFLQSSRITNNGNNINVVVDEYQPPYIHTRTGKKNDARMIRWNVLFGQYFIKFIKSNFKKGMLVKIKGTARPYAEKIDNDDDDENESIRVGVLGETIVRSFNSYDLNIDEERIRKSQKNAEYTPNLSDYLDDDF